MKLLAQLEKQLQQLDEQKLRRRRRIVEKVYRPHVAVDGQDKLSFASNDYLGLVSHPQLIQALAEGAQRYGVGSGASHLLSGHSRAHALLEQRLSQFVGGFLETPRALYFSTGYMANLAVVSALATADSDIFSEQSNHASLIDAARLASGRVQIYPHCDLASLQKLLAASSALNKLIVTDSVFSMDGDLAPLRQLLVLAQAYDAWLIVDDAHGFGVLGNSGSGVLEHYALSSPHLVYIGTLGKAAGVAGAFVVAHATLIEWLMQRARSYIFTTASPPALAHALLTSIDLIQGHEGQRRREHLRQLIAHLRDQLKLARWNLGASQTAIQPIIIGANHQALKVAALLDEQDIWVPAIRPPSVPSGTARLRITLSAAHRFEDIDRLCAALTAIELKS